MTIWLSNKRTQIICGADKVLLMASLWMQSSLNSSGYLHYCISSFSLGEKQKQKMSPPPPSLTLFWRKQMHSSEQLFISKDIMEKNPLMSISIRRVSIFVLLVSFHSHRVHSYGKLMYKRRF